MKIGRTAVIALLVFGLSGCASVQLSGKPFYPANQTADLTGYLDAGIGKASKKELAEKLNGVPEITVNENSEVWVYKSSETRNRLLINVFFSTRYDETSANELKLTFNKNGLLASYQLNQKNSKGKESMDYGYKLGDGIVVGIISGVVFSVVNTLIQNIKDKK